MPPIKILIAPNAFKGSISASEAADRLEEGLKLSKADIVVKKLPIGDGGDGTGDLITKYLHGKEVHVKVKDPLGRIINSRYGLADSGKTAVIEMANASGIRLLKKNELNPLKTDSYGTGELIADALERGVDKIIFTIGGSATVDGGTGILRALGVRFCDEKGDELTDLPIGLNTLSTIDMGHVAKRALECELIVLCDVFNPLLGENGAAAVFGPQKGADKDAVQQLEVGLKRLSEMVFTTTGRKIDGTKHGGAAGGVAASLFGLLNAKLIDGSDYFLSLIDFEKAVKDADIVITGEGAIDEQTLKGKGPFAVASLSRKYKKKTIGIAGKIDVDESSNLWDYFDLLLPINFQIKPIEEAILDTGKNIKLTGFNLGRLINNLALLLFFVFFFI